MGSDPVAAAVSGRATGRSRAARAARRAPSWAGTRERLLRALGELDGAAVGVVDRAVLLEHAQQLAPTALGVTVALAMMSRTISRAAPSPLLQQMDERQRHLAFAQVAADRLAERLGVAGEVQQVVDELERDAEVEAVLAQRLLLLVLDLAEHAADLRAAAEQVRGLAADDVEVLVLGDVGVAVLRELVQLAFDHPQRDVAQHRTRSSVSCVSASAIDLM